MIRGEDLGEDLSNVKVIQKDSKHHVPSSRMFNIYKFKNPETLRYLKVLKCEHLGCSQSFKKWHNFYNHLRTHTNERPFECVLRFVINCKKAFTQKSNLNKHVKQHLINKFKEHRFKKINEFEILQVDLHNALNKDPLEL